MEWISWLPLISRIVWAKTPQNPRDVATLNFIFITVFVSVISFFLYTLINLPHFFFSISHALPKPRSLHYGLIYFIFFFWHKSRSPRTPLITLRVNFKIFLLLYELVIGFPEGWDPGLIWGL